MEFLFNASALALGLFVPLAAIDGVYLHLWKFRLHLRADTQREHALHTLHAVLFVPLLVLLYAGNTAGWALWAGVAVALLNLGIMVLDIREERTSRRFQGGLPRLEVRLHLVLIALQIVGTALSLAARPAAAWTASASATSAQVAAAATTLALAWQWILPGAIVMAAVHVGLLALGQWRLRSSALFLAPAHCC